MATISAERFTALKAKVKAEMLRRCKSGSVADYGGTAYDYTTAPAAGKVILKEHIEKLTTPMRAVNADLVPAPGSVVSESELANLETRITAWAKRSLTDRSASDCKSGCTGTCYTGCTTGCSGCGSECGGCTGCSGGCEGCTDGCTNGCTVGCSHTCATNCIGCDGGCQGCGFACSNDCTNNCTGQVNKG